MGRAMPRFEWKLAIRGLKSNPVLAVTATLTLAICIAANTTVFSLVNSILLRQLPYTDSQRLYWIDERMGREQMAVGVAADYFSLREKNRAFQDVGAYQSITLNWIGPEKAEQLAVAQVTPSFFRVLGTPPLMGRYLASEEQGSKAPPVAILSYAFWRSRLGSDPNIIGKTILLSGSTEGAGQAYAVTVLGVMPEGFDYPRGALLWRPSDLDERSERVRSPNRPMRLVNVVARLTPGINAQQLDTEMKRLTTSIRREYPKSFESAGFLAGMRISATPLHSRMTGSIRPALLLISGAVGLVLLIACSNLANILLARGISRQREIAVCIALGSGRRRIVRQMLFESLALALPGGVAGATIAYFAVQLLNAWKPLVLQNYPAISLDVRTLIFTLALTLTSGLLFGLVPAFIASRINIQESLKAPGNAQSTSRGAARMRRMLVITELSISLVLLIGAALLARSFLKLSHIELGFPSENILTLRTNLTGSSYTSAQTQSAFYHEVLERVRRLPMVQAAAVTTNIPLSSDSFDGMRFEIAGRPELPIAQQPSTAMTVVSRDFFRALNIPLRSGRVFKTSDSRRTKDIVVVNEAFVHEFLASETPIDKAIVFGPTGRRVYWNIAGVVGNTREGELGADPRPLVYRCDCQMQDPFLSRMALVIRTKGDPHSAVHSVEQQLYAVDRNEPVFDVRTMEERLETSLAPHRFHLLLIGTFAVLAIVIAAIGTYGVVSYLVARRSREIGIRLALGARRHQVVVLVVGETLTWALISACIGVLAAAGVMRYLQSMLYGITPLDTVSFVITPFALILIALAAAFAPAQKASAIDPLVALREE